MQMCVVPPVPAPVAFVRLKGAHQPADHLGGQDVDFLLSPLTPDPIKAPRSIK